MDIAQQENDLFLYPHEQHSFSLKKYKYWSILMKMTSTADILKLKCVIKYSVN